MGHRANSFKLNRRPPAQQTRVIVTALAERDAQVLLVQLARGRFAGFWLLPSATVEEGTVTETARRMLPERTGYPVVEQQLASVVEEPKPEVLALRFVLRTRVGEATGERLHEDIAQARWFSRDAAGEVLEERDVVPTLGVMALIRAWADGMPLRPLELLIEDASCPCGSGHAYRGCCGWDAR